MHNLHSNDLRPNRAINTEENDLIDHTKTLIEDWEVLKESIGEKAAQKELGISRATYYRRKKLWLACCMERGRHLLNGQSILVFAAGESIRENWS
ncbi:hypothetical protein FACS1894122_05870 [Alphaproteobacteria bacterium]|nr:hypothetical protein FACS1894122_05870 [Alphaproteobacteria bacterium]